MTEYIYVTTDFRPVTLAMLTVGGFEVRKITREEFDAVWYADGNVNESSTVA